MSAPSRGWRVLIVGVVVALGGGFALLRTVEGRVAPKVAERLSGELGAACFVDRVRVLGLRRVRVEGLSCRWVDGSVAGVDVGAIAVLFSRIPTGDPLPEPEEVTITRGQVSLRHVALPGEGPDGDDSASPGLLPDPRPLGGSDELPDPATLPPTGMERAVERFLDLSRELDGEPAIAARVRRVLSRLSPRGRIRVSGMRVTEEGAVAVRDVRAELNRAGKGGNAAVAVALEGGGVMAAELTLNATGLEQSRFQLEGVPLRTPLDRVDAAAMIQGGTVTGELRIETGGPWVIDLTVHDLAVQHEFLGGSPVVIASLGGRGDLRPDAGLGTLSLIDGRWRLGEAGGDLALDLTEVGSDRGASLTLEIGAGRMPPAAALAALPEQIVPRAWAEEIQGTMDFRIQFVGPLRLRPLWNLDWSWDFARMSLADGELARQVQSMAEPFAHTFPPARREEPGPVRVVGPSDAHFVPLQGISTWLQTAVVATEDAGFWGHSGFEPTEIKVAVLENLRLGGGRGGSTITQQLAKNLFLSGERTATRKLQEALLAWRLEEELPKQRLLELYLNIAEWGPGLYGARDAAEHYFGRSPATLQPEEAAFLASLLPSPVRFHGYYHHGGLTENRQERVREILDTMLRLGRMTPDEHQRATAGPVGLAGCPW